MDIPAPIITTAITIAGILAVTIIVCCLLASYLDPPKTPRP